MKTVLSSVISDLLGTEISSDNSPACTRHKQELYANSPVTVSMLSRLCFAATEKRVPFSGGESKGKSICQTEHLKPLQGC